MRHAVMRTQCNVVPGLDILILCKAQRVALDDFFCKRLGSVGRRLERGEDRGRRRILHLGWEDDCISTPCGSRVCWMSELGELSASGRPHSAQKQRSRTALLRIRQQYCRTIQEACLPASLPRLNCQFSSGRDSMVCSLKLAVIDNILVLSKRFRQLRSDIAELCSVLLCAQLYTLRTL